MASTDTAAGVAGPGPRTVLPEFPEALHWVNCREAPRLFDLRGCVVLLVFWNAASISSMNLLADLRALARRRPGEFVLLTVHTPRYASQQSDAAVLQALQRCRVHAPVANDHEWQAWLACSITAWPTVLLIDADGTLAARFVGEGQAAGIEAAIAQVQEGLPPVHARVQDDFLEATQPRATGPLAFPACALATETRLYVSDAGHHRVLECLHGGQVLRQFGSGTAGNWDGHIAASGFQSPQGLALGNGCLYVADAGNHGVRRVHLETGEVDTVLGTGAAAVGGIDGAPGQGLRVAVNAPHAVAVDGEVLYVAATGQHQLLRVNLPAQQVAVLAGDGRMDVRDGIGAESSLAAPAALAQVAGQLLVADAGGNAIRRLRLADLAVGTLAGAGPWEPGRLDGSGRDARLAWPAGLAVDGERVYVADTCNDRLCVLDPFSGALRTLAVDGELHAPSGLSFAAGRLWVANRAAHAILAIDPASGGCESVAVAE